MNKTARSSAASDECTEASKHRDGPRRLDAPEGKHTSILAIVRVSFAFLGPSVTTNTLLLTTCSLVNT